MKPKVVAVSASELVILAIHSLEMMNPHRPGPTQDEIIQFISSKYKVNPRKIRPNVQSALLRSITFGIIAEKNEGYQLEDVPQPPSNYKTRELERDKVGSLIVEVSQEKMQKKKKKKSDIRVDDILRPLVLEREDDFCRDCHPLAKRKRGKSKDEDDFEPREDRNEYMKELPGSMF